MRRFDTLLHVRLQTRLSGRAVALSLSFALTFALVLAVAGSAYGVESIQDKNQTGIQKILDDNAGNPDGLKDAIKKVFGDVQGKDAVHRTQQILDALPEDLSFEDWETIRAALKESSMQLGRSRESRSINDPIDNMLEDIDMRFADRQYSSPMPPPPQTTVVCVSENC